MEGGARAEKRRWDGEVKNETSRKRGGCGGWQGNEVENIGRGGIKEDAVAGEMRQDRDKERRNKIIKGNNKRL